MHLFADHPVLSARRHAAWLARLMIVLVVMLHSWVAYSSVASASHEPLVCGAECGIDPLAHEAGHSHDHDALDTDGGDRVGHQHGHDPTDHSHDKSDLTSHGDGPILDGAGRWWAPTTAEMKPAPFFNFERPPRRLPSI